MRLSVRRQAIGRVAPLPALVIVALTILGGFGLGTGLFLAHAATPSASIAPVPPGAAARPGAPMAPLGARPAAAPTCQDTQASEDTYAPVKPASITFYPLYPNSAFQSPCYVTALDPNLGGTFNDEIHASFDSYLNGSGDRFTVPMRLPLGTYLNESGAFNDFYLDMVVTGNAKSVDNQSLVELVFSPVNATGSLEFDATVQAISLYDNGSCGGAGLPAYGLSFSWNNLNACEGYDIHGGKGIRLASALAAGDYLSVTFNGAGNTGVTVYLNDSTASVSNSTTLSKAVTGSYTYNAEFRSACPQNCILNWSMPFGNGFGVDLGSTGMDTLYQSVANPVWIGAPEYFTGSGYTGDFSALETESASGRCTTTNPGSVIPCPSGFNNFGYPYFQSNGTWLLFGSSSDYAWTTRDLGTDVDQFSSNGAGADFNPMQLDHIANSSVAGFLTSSQGLNVTVRIQDLGSGETAKLAYTLPDGTSATIPMGRYSGNASIGHWGANLPTTGGDGRIFYSITATSAANTTVRLPVNSKAQFMVQRGPSIPSFNVSFYTNPSANMSIEFAGTNYSSYQSVKRQAGVYGLAAWPGRAYEFGSWNLFQLSIPFANRTVSPISLNLTENGSITANFVYVRPHDTIQLAFPNGCGSMTLNRTFYGSAATVSLLDGLGYPLSYGGCAQNDFAGWTVAPPGNLSVYVTNYSTTFTPHGNGTLSLNFVPVSSNPVALSFATNPPGCGGVLYNGAEYATGTTVSLAPSTAEPIAPAPCKGWAFESWNVSLGITISGTSVTAIASGLVTANYYPLTIVYVHTVPAGCGYVTINSVAYYNGQSAIVQNGSNPAIRAYPCSGYYFAGWNASGQIFITGGLASSYEAYLTVRGSGGLQAAFLQGIPKYFVAFITNPAGCGTIDFNGRTYVGSDYTEVTANSVATLSAVSGTCNSGTAYGFVGWTVGGLGITIAQLNLTTTIAYLNGSGSIQANFHPLTEVTFETNPSNCGTITVDGMAVPTNTNLSLPAPGLSTISAKACPHYHLASWETTAGAQVIPQNYSLVIESGAIVTAFFKADYYTVSLGVSTGKDGEISINAAGSVNDFGDGVQWTTTYGNYSISAVPPTGFSLVGWTTSGSVSVLSNTSASTRLYVNGSGTLSATYEPALPIVELSAPASALSGSGVTFVASVTDPVPGTSYLYTWSFGDGSPVTTTASGTVTHEYPAPGPYVVTVSVVDSYHRTASTSATIQAVRPTNGSFTAIGPVGYAVIGIAALVIVAAVLLGRRRPTTPAEATSEIAPPKP